MSADSPIMGQWPDTQQQDSLKAYALSGKIMLTSVITLFIIVFFLVLLHLYARWYLTRLHRRYNDPQHPNRPTRIVYYVANNNNNNNRPLPLATCSSGLDASILKSLPLFVYSNETKAKTKTIVDVLECAVCLSEFEEGETGRVLPNCKHCFHTGCIDMWFYSHSTCPICRSPVEPVQTEAEPGSSASLMETTSLEEGRRKRVDVRIDVPVSESVTEGELRMTSPSPIQGFRSPGSRLLSLKRIMNMGRVSPSSGDGPSCVPGGTESGVDLARNESDHELSRQGNIG